MKLIVSYSGREMMVNRPLSQFPTLVQVEKLTQA